MTHLSCKIVALGAWGVGFSNWPDLQNLLQGGVAIEKLAGENIVSGPKPDIIPANERRRAPLPVRLAVESSWQATQLANVNPQELSCVFVSGIGDTQLTDYMCKVLATDNKQLSPTKFHNSVHNAAAGYWTMSTGCMKAASSIAGFGESVPLALLEAIVQCVSENVSVLLTFYDAPSCMILQNLLKNDQSFSVSMIIVPLASKKEGTLLAVEVKQQAANWPAVDFPANLQHCYENNPAARLLPILEKIKKQNCLPASSLNMPLSTGSSLSITVG